MPASSSTTRIRAPVGVMSKSVSMPAILEPGRNARIARLKSPAGRQHPVANSQPTVRLQATRVRHAPLLAGSLDVVDPEGVVPVRAFDGDSGGGLQLGGPSGVVQMAVGDPDLVQGQAVGLQGLQQARN